MPATASLARHIKASCAGVARAHIKRDELVVETTPENVIQVLEFLRDDAQCRFTQLLDICGVDYLEHQQSLAVVYHLLSMDFAQRVRLRLSVTENDIVPSAVSVFASANWYEREAFDMFGILFGGHPDLRRLLTDYGFVGHPLRKDFPLTGRVEVCYDEKQARVVNTPVELVQDFRDFDFVSPWEGSGEGTATPAPAKKKTDSKEK